MIACITMRVIRDRVRAMRRGRAMTQEDLADIAGCSVVTIQRAERGEALSANTIASIAAAFDVAADELTGATQDDRPYLPLDPISGGRALIAPLSCAYSLNFGFDELESLDQAIEIEAFRDFCSRQIGGKNAVSPVALTARELEAKELIARLGALGFSIYGAKFETTAYDVDDDCGAGLPILLAKWDATEAVLRLGFDHVVERAYVLDDLGQWETPRGDAIVYPAPTTTDEGSDGVDDGSLD